MDDAMKRFLEEADALRKLGDFDIEKRLGLSGAAAEAMKSIGAYNPVKDVSFPEVRSFEMPPMPKIPGIMVL